MLYIHAKDIPLLSPAITKEMVWERLNMARKKNNSGVCNWWAHMPDPADKRKVLVDYTTIPSDWLAKYNAPPATEVRQVLKEKLQEVEDQLRQDAILKQQIKEDSQNQTKLSKYNDVYCDFFMAKKEFPIWYNEIRDTPELASLPPEKIREGAEKAAVIQKICETYARSKNSLETVTKAFNSVFPPKKALSKSAKNSFSNKLRGLLNSPKISKADVIRVAVDMRSVVKVKPRQSAENMELLKALFVKNNMTKAPDAYRALLEVSAASGSKPMPLATVKYYWKQFKKDIDLVKRKSGHNAASKKMPYMTMENARNRHSLYFIDGKTIPFFTWREDRKGAERWVVSMVMDSHSQMIIGYEMAPTENGELIFNLIYNTTCKYGVIAPECITDVHSGYQISLFKNFIPAYEAMGGTFTCTTNPQAKAPIEAKNKYFDAYWKDFPDYLGGGMNAKSENMRPSEEGQRDALKSKNYKSIDETKLLIIGAIEQYNNKPQKCLNGLTPMQAFEQSESKHAFRLSTEDRLKLFKPMTARKISNGQVNIKVGMTTYQYRLNSELFNNWNDETVNVIWEDLRDEIYLFDIKSGDFIGTVPLKPTVPVAKVDRTEKDNERINQFTGVKKGIMSKAKKANEDALNETLRANPEFAEKLNYVSASKDILKEAQNNRLLQLAAADHGVSVDKIPERPQTAKYALPVDKKAEQVFAVANHVPYFPTLEELMEDNTD